MNLSILEVLTNSVDLDEMPVNAIESHQNLVCLLCYLCYLCLVLLCFHVRLFVDLPGKG